MFGVIAAGVKPVVAVLNDDSTRETSGEDTEGDSEVEVRHKRLGMTLHQPDYLSAETSTESKTRVYQGKLVFSEKTL